MPTEMEIMRASTFECAETGAATAASGRNHGHINHAAASAPGNGDAGPAVASGPGS